MSDLEQKKIFRQLYNQLDPQQRLAATRQLTELGEAGAAVLAQALLEFPGLNGKRNRLLHYNNEKFNQYSGIYPPFIEEPPFYLIQGLIFIGEPAFPQIVRLWLNERLEVRLAATHALEYHTFRDLLSSLPDPGPIVEGLCQTLRHEDPKVRARMYPLLYRLAGKADPALALLAGQYQKCSSYQEQFEIVECLLTAKAWKEIIAEVVGDALEQGSREAQRRILTHSDFSACHEQAAPLVPWMVTFIKRYGISPEYRERSDAGSVAHSLGQLLQTGEQAILALARDPDVRLHPYALEAIQWYSYRDPDKDLGAFVEFLMDQLESDQTAKKSDTERLLREHRARHGLPEAVEARWIAYQQKQGNRNYMPEYLRPLIYRLQAPEAATREQAAWTLRSAEILHDEIGPPLLAACLETHASRWAIFINLLKSQAPRFGALAPALSELLKDNRYATFAFEILKTMGPSAAPATAHLVEMVAQGEDSDMAINGLRVLGCIGPAALNQEPGLITWLTGCLENPKARIRLNAAWVLGNMGAESQATRPALNAMTSDLHPGVAAAARQSLERIAPAKTAA